MMGNSGSRMARRDARTARDRPPPLRQTMRREIAWILVFKLAALWLLWAMFFSPEHRHAVDREATSRRFAVMPTCQSVPTKECKENKGE
jgi:hypothetical protein